MNREEYNMPTRCENCDSDNLTIRFIFDADKCIAKYICNDCGHDRSIAKNKNLVKRNNTSFSNWACRTIKHHPFCWICGSKEDLEAHHIIPVSHSWKHAYLDQNGLTLCRKCHYLVHNKEI